ncbi:methyltransferase domain-containing protein [Pseudonocardia sp. KRD291]|uniref:methyltransferase domain-containing protein n=1 Tax=Pseudonocardia sp. KRD291 TaxID=2792007 RepID=UPI001C5C5A92|nr:methyltransferase domain-containing protein [Pseudonocardia sp. KRD291]MBW0105009.1 methyltransferase [Pseudonocardia sp. KRD291]
MDLLTLPPPLPAERIVELNRPKGDLHTTRSYRWNGWDIEVPPGVFRPGLTSAMIFDRVLSGEIEVRGRRYLAMGCGLGVEVAAAAARGAADVYAVDVHPASVATAADNARRLAPARPAGERSTRVHAVVADVLDGFPQDTRVDVVTFNPPAVSRPVSDDPDVVRNVCAGAPLLERFFAQLAGRDVLAPGAEVYVIASNTADLREIVAHAVAHGFTSEVALRHDWDDGVLTYLFRFTAGARA